MKWHSVERGILVLPTDSSRIDYLCVCVDGPSADRVFSPDTSVSA